MQASYLAPEVIGKVYNHKCDNWSLGIFLYLLLTGTTPFTGKDQEETFLKIKQDAPSFTSPVWETVSKEAKQLIQGLLEKDPLKRL
jgi:serine/threonine protein kinase